MKSIEGTTIRAICVVLIVAASITLAPVWVALVLAAWFADVLQTSVRRLQRLFGGRRRGAAAVVVILALVVLTPVIGVSIGVISGAVDLVAQLRAAAEDGHKGSLAEAFIGGPPGQPPRLRDWVQLFSRYGANAWDTATTVLRASSTFVIGLLVFGLGLYTLALRGPRVYAYLARHAPMPRFAFIRFARAFFETGRGLLIGTGVTAFAQGVTATIAYVALGIPRALLLGPLTMIAALVPVFGTGLVWVPLAVGLAITHEWPRAIAIAVLGAGVFSLMDNFLRPVLTRYGKLRMSTYLVLVSMLGGVGAFGGMGILLGPLIMRLAIEALEIARECRSFRSLTLRDRSSGL